MGHGSVNVDRYMCIKRYFLIPVLLLFCISAVYSQEKRIEVSIDFRVNSTVVDTAYLDNAARISELLDILNDVTHRKDVKVVEVSFCGAASPEGPYAHNRKLARGRLSALEKLVRDRVDISDSIITRSDAYVDWHFLRDNIETIDMEYRDSILSILHEDSATFDYHHPWKYDEQRIQRLKSLDDGKAWKHISKHFKKMRNACVVLFVLDNQTPPVQTPPAQTPPVVEDTVASEPAATAPDTVTHIEAEMPAPQVWTRQLHLQTNILGLGLGIVNVGAEIDLAKHWTFVFPVYYSAWDYFKPTIKFRTFAIQPEVRYWLSGSNTGPFAGVHFGLGYYNLAWDGLFRYQDHSMKTPAVGGGLSIGYRKTLGASKRWSIDFSVGAGAYSLEYDRFINVDNGIHVDKIERTYFGLDHVAVSITYTIDLAKESY